LIEIYFTIRIKQTPKQNEKSNNIVQNGKQRNATLRHQKHEQTQQNKLDLCGKHLFN